MMRLGQFIVVEGMEGAGKSTAIAAVLDILKQHQIEAITVREPGGTEQGEILRAMLKNPDFKEIMDARTELLLMYAARTQLVEEVIKPALNNNIWVVADRFEWSTFAYQGGGRALDPDMIQHLSAFCLDGFQPDLTLFMDITPEAGMQRATQRGPLDRFEKESMTFFHKVYAAYHKLLKHKKQVAIIDASAPLTTVLSVLKETMNRFIDSHAR